MAHENSRTMGWDNRWYNVYGKDLSEDSIGTTGDPLPLLYPFEQESYDTEQVAIEAAKKRSNLHGILTSGINPWSGTIWDMEGFNREPTHKIRSFSERWEDFKERHRESNRLRLLNNPHQGRFPGGGSH